MKFLADENLDAMIVRWLREQNTDVIYAAESAQAEPDEILLEKANLQNRIIITSDRDFGEMIFRQRLNSFGIILLRFRSRAQSARLTTFISFWGEMQRRIQGHFIVATENRLRIRPLYTAET